MIDLALFRVRSFAVANAGGFVFALGFYALLLSNILFLTGIWHYSILRAGVAVTPGPLMAALAAPVGGRLSDRFEQRIVAVPGTLLFAAGALLFALEMGAGRSYAGEFLPATLLTGAGVGLSFAAFGNAAVAELPRNRYATGGAINNCFRQIGAVLGISTLIVILAAASPADALHLYHRAWALIALAGLALGRVRPRYALEAAAMPTPLAADETT